MNGDTIVTANVLIKLPPFCITLLGIWDLKVILSVKNVSCGVRDKIKE
jgi:hypothetical protein